MEAKQDVIKLYKLENSNNFNAIGLEAMANVATKTKEALQHKLVKLLPIVDPKLGPKFLQQIKIHYSKNVDPKMTQDQLYNVAISKIDAKEKCQWLKI
jgi:hypothetical protein